ncbi:DUF2589 domain-containing protein [Bacterioplanoides sp.]|uniref:DUF2589 domain-containing protein n=1 Tax=Bacterioplanoides sp. TaxID=2066072 RepID=UPI003B00141B
MAIGDELSNIDFKNLIGSPLISVVQAQAQSAQTSVDFIKSVGFEQDSNTPTMVTFSYMKPIESTDSDGNTTVTPVKHDLTVPILTMLPIPFIRVEETTIDFNAKINSVQESTSTSSHDLSTSLSAKAGWGPVSAKLSASYSYKKSTSATSKTERTYSMAVHVRAVQDELPAGTERLLGILENAIEEVPAST